jgi:hypothetical protein
MFASLSRASDEDDHYYEHHEHHHHHEHYRHWHPGYRDDNGYWHEGRWIIEVGPGGYEHEPE